MIKESFDKESIVSKIKKLLTLANSTEGNENERDTAMKMVAKLITQYKIVDADINTPKEGTISKSFKASSSTWVRNIINSVVKMNYCSMYYIRIDNSYAFFYVIGKEIEVDASIELSKVLIKSIGKEARTKAKLYPYDKSYKRSFENSASYRVGVRTSSIITDLIEHEKSEGTGKDLMIINQYDQAEEDNQKYLDEQNIKIKIKSSRTFKLNSYSGYVDGNNYGKTLNIS